MLVFWKKTLLPYSSREDMFPGYRHLNRWPLCVKRAHRPGTAPIFFFYCGCPFLNGKHLFLRRHGALVILHNNGLPVSFLVHLCHAARSSLYSPSGLPRHHYAWQDGAAETQHSTQIQFAYGLNHLDGLGISLTDHSLIPYLSLSSFPGNALNISLQLIVWSSSMGKYSESAKRSGPKQLAYCIAHAHNIPTTPLIFIYK